MIFDIKFVKAREVSPQQNAQLTNLNAECFGDVPEREIAENFIAEPFGYLFAIVKDEMISRVALFRREVIFAKTKIALGGIGGVCVAHDYRHHGVATSMVKRALVVLTQEKCDVACLNVDLEKKVYPMYEKLGFTLMPRDISIENVRGEIIHEPGTMFVPLISPEKYDLIMNSTQTFHYGHGYW